jgi:hydroxyacylglutathione hydrolase
MVSVEVIATEALGDRSYIAHDGTSAVVVDPQRDIDRVEARLGDLGVRCALVVETHIHNDYVTGGYQLAREAGVDYVVAAADQVAFDRRPVADGDELSVGTLSVRAVATPGHTDHHLSYVVSDGQGPAAVFTGGSLLYGSVGRTDLVDPHRTEELTRTQYRSARRLAEALPPDTRIYPTHGFGSFCSAGTVAGGEVRTIGAEREANTALTEPDEQAFVDRIVANLTAYPAYYAHMAPINRTGPAPIDLSPPKLVEPDELHAHIAAGGWVVDLRDRTAYAADHVAGTLGIELAGQFATWLGWLIPWGTPLMVVGATEQQVTDAQRHLARIGIDDLAGHTTDAPDRLASREQRSSYPTVGFAEVIGAGLDEGGGRVLDVRHDHEWAAGHIPGAVHLPLHELPQRTAELPGTRLWVHCASGYRASIAASLLDRAGHDVVLINDHYSRAVELGLTTESADR